MKSKDYLSRGVDLVYKKDYFSGLLAFEKAIELKPSYVLAWFNKGAALFKLDRIGESIMAFEEANRVDPTFDGAWASVSNLYMIKGRLEDGLNAAEKAIAINPNSDVGWFNKACAHALLKHKDKALESLEKAIQLKDEYRNAAREDEDLKSLWGDKEFKKLVKSPTE